MNQLRQILRRLAKAPVFTAITLITLAAGIGANTVIFSVVEGVLLKPLPYPHSEELVGVWHEAPGIGLANLNSSPSNYFIYKEQNRSFEEVGLYRGDTVSVTGSSEPEQVSILSMTQEILPALHVAPVQGRVFNQTDDSPDQPMTAILMYGYWKKKFGGASSAIGSSIVVDGHSTQIIGVMPQNFHFLYFRDPALIMPFQLDRGKTKLGNFSYSSLARLKPGTTIQQASADVARMLPMVMQSFPAPEGFSATLFEKARIGPQIVPLKNDVIGTIGKTLWVIMGSIGLVLLIACANVANLLLVRVEGRRQELAVRAALGAGRARIAMELLLESVVLGVLGTAIGLGLAFGALRLLVAMQPVGLPRIDEIGIDGTVLLFALGVCLLVSLFVGTIPILKYSGARLNTGIREGGRASSASRDQHRARGVLVVVQVALALVLLICSGLMIRTFRAMMKVTPGFTEPTTLQTFRISVPDTMVKDPEQVLRMDEAILHKIEAIPGVRSVSIGSMIPMDGNRNNDPVFAQDRTYAQGEMAPLRRFKSVTPGFPQTLGTPLKAGRDFTWNDLYQKLPVAIVSENLAREYWHDAGNAVGKRIRVATTDDWREVIGVVADVYDDGTDSAPPASVYWPILLTHFEGPDITMKRDVAFAIRTPRADSQAFLGELRQAVWSVNPNLPLAEVHTLDYYYTRAMAQTSFTLIMLAVAGGMALLLGTVGIYGVIAYSVSQRRREIGIRMALGAQQEIVTNMFVRHGMILTAIGVVSGLCTAAVVMRLMSSLLFQVKPVDPLTYSTVSLGLLATAFLASYLPSRRAAKVDPVEALRAE